MNTIVEVINAAGRAFVGFSLPMLIQSSVLILILLAVDAILRRKVRAVFRYWIWTLVLIKLILPPSLGSPVSIGTWFGDRLEVPTASLFEPEGVVPAEPQAAGSFPIVSGLPALPDPMIVQPLVPTTIVAPSSPVAPQAQQPATVADTTMQVAVRSLSWQGLTLLVWSAVVIALTLLLVQRAFFVQGLVGQAEEASRGLLAELEGCRHRLGLRQRIGLRLSPNTASPAVCGLFRPVILIPHALAPRLPSHDLQAVLLHELAHVRRGDLCVNLAQTVLQIVYFYNPLLWLANAVIRRIREQAVDEMVLVAMGETAQQYPQTLVNVAKLAFARRPALSLRLVGVVESKSALTARVKHILSRPIPKTAKLGVLGLLVILLFAVVLLPMAKAQQPVERQDSADIAASGESNELNRNDGDDGSRDSDGDGLSDFQEIHKYLTDPAQADSDGDGVPDGDWDERREYTYSVRTVLRYMPPFDEDGLNDDFQDARVLAQTGKYIEVEVIHYPLATGYDSIPENRNWRRDYAGMTEFLAPGVTTNWDDAMQRDLLAALKADGIDVETLSDKQVVEQVSSWLMKRSRSLDKAFTTYYVHFPQGKPEVYPGLEDAFRREFERDSANYDWTIAQHFDHEVLGRGMFYNKTHGSCTSTAVYLTTVLRAVGIPTRMVLVTPAVDASDREQILRVKKALTHNRVRETMLAGLRRSSHGFTNHTLNEVYVGGRWRRLDCTQLDRPTFGVDRFGLQTHLCTFNDLSDVSFAPTWGRRYAKGERSDIFKHDNPYSAVEVSEFFGPHGNVPNSPFSARDLPSNPLPDVFLFGPEKAHVWDDFVATVKDRTWNKTGRPHSKEYYDNIFQGVWATKPGDILVLLFSLDTPERIPEGYEDLLPRPWSQIESELSQGRTVELAGKAREMNVILLATPTADGLKPLVRSSGLLNALGKQSRGRAMVAGIGPAWEVLRDAVGTRYRGTIGGFGREERRSAEYLDKVLSWTKPGDAFVLMLAFDESPVVPEQYRDLLPLPWSDIESRVQRGESVEIRGKARGHDVIVLAAATSEQLNALVRKTPLLDAYRAEASKEITLPDVDQQAVMLDLATGQLVPTPQVEPAERIMEAIKELGKGDLVLDHQSLILVRGATSPQAAPGPEDLVNIIEIGSTLPRTVTVTTVEGGEYRIEVRAVDDKGCTLSYSPISTAGGDSGDAPGEPATAVAMTGVKPSDSSLVARLANGVTITLMAYSRLGEAGLEWWTPQGERTTIPGVYEADVEGHGSVLALRADPRPEAGIHAWLCQPPDVQKELKPVWRVGDSDIWLVPLGEGRNYVNVEIMAQVRDAVVVKALVREGFSLPGGFQADQQGAAQITDVNRVDSDSTAFSAPAGLDAPTVVAALDISGQVHSLRRVRKGDLQPIYGPELSGRRRCETDIPPDRFAGIVVEGYRERAGLMKLGNLSLRPGQPTQVRVEAEPEQRGPWWHRSEYDSKLDDLGRRLLAHAKTHGRSYPGDLPALRTFCSDELWDWLQGHVVYLGAGRSSSQAETVPLAYEKTLLSFGFGTYVLYSDGNVEFVVPSKLKELSISTGYDRRTEGDPDVKQKMKRLALAISMFADDHQGNLPATLSALSPYLRDPQALAWLDENVAYVGKGSVNRRRGGTMVTAYEKASRPTGERYVLFLDYHVELAGPQRLAELNLKNTGPADAGMLEFRVAPRAEEIGSGIVERYERALTAGERPPDGDFAWFPSRAVLVGSPGAIIQEREGTTYVLLWNKPPHAILASQDWGLDRVYKITDATGRPAIGLTLNEKGASLFHDITAANVKRPLAILVDGKVVSMPHIMSPLGSSAMIVGTFTSQEVDDMIAALRSAQKGVSDSTLLPTPPQGVSGRVVDPNGLPVAGAQVALCSKDKGAIIRAGQLVPTGRVDKSSEIVQTDAQGRFSFASAPEEFHLIAAHDEGFTWVTSEELCASTDLRLERWAKIEGTLKIGQALGADERVDLLNYINKNAIDQNVRFDYQSQTDAAGRFVFTKVPPGWVEVGYLIRTGENTSTHTCRTPIHLEPGQNIQMALGGQGRPVVGRFAPPADYHGPVYFGAGLRAFSTSRPERPQPDNYDQMTKRQQADWYDQWRKTPEAQAYYDAMWHDLDRRHYAFRIQDDGSFRIEDVTPGKYEFTVWLEEQSTGQGRPEEIGGYYGTAQVPAMTQAYTDEPLDLGDLTLSMRNPALHVGDAAPLFEAKTLDGRDIRLADYRGQFVLLSFWQPVFHPELDRLKELHKTYGTDGRLGIVEFAGDDTLEEVTKYIKEHRIEWPEVYLGEKGGSDIAKRYGDPCASYILLVNPEGKIVATWLREEKLTKTVQDAIMAADSAKSVPSLPRSIQQRIDAAAPGGTVRLEPGTYHERLTIDLRFVAPQAKGFSLKADSPARQKGIGAAEPISFAGPWPLQPEELAIIPQGDTRDYRQWRDPSFP